MTLALDARRTSFRRASFCRAAQFIILPIFCLAVAASAHATVKVGDAAPDFSGMDSYANQQSLSQYHGKFVVLEWHNQGCPFTKKHYDSGNMEKLQREWTAKGVVWLTIISSAPGQQGYVTASEENQYLKRMHAAPTAVILDADGKIGHEYDAKTTPQIIIVDPAGKVVYDGAIDDHPTPEASDIPSSKNYVSAALNQAMAGQQVATPYTRPYGCSVKYSGGN